MKGVSLFSKKSSPSPSSVRSPDHSSKPKIEDRRGFFDIRGRRSKIEDVFFYCSASKIEDEEIYLLFDPQDRRCGNYSKIEASSNMVKSVLQRWRKLFEDERRDSLKIGGNVFEDRKIIFDLRVRRTKNPCSIFETKIDVYLSLWIMFMQDMFG